MATIASGQARFLANRPARVRGLFGNDIIEGIDSHINKKHNMKGSQTDKVVWLVDKCLLLFQKMLQA